MGRIEKHGKDAIAMGIDAKPGRKFQTGPRDDTPPAEANAHPGTLAAALEQSEVKRPAVTRHGDDAPPEQPLTDSYGRPLSGTMLMAAGLERKARQREEEGR